MSILRVSLAADPGLGLNPLDIEVPLELINGASQVVKRAAIHPSQPLDLFVERGWYLVCVYLPSGEQVE